MHLEKSNLDQIPLMIVRPAEMKLRSIVLTTLTYVLVSTFRSTGRATPCPSLAELICTNVVEASHALGRDASHATGITIV